jgi:transposase InsO family protein
MQIRLHANATTTPHTRAYIQRSDLPVSVLARELGVDPGTIRRWRSRSDVNDRSHKAHRLAISLDGFEEQLVCELRREIGLGIDDITEVMQRCVRPDLSRSAIYRCLRRHGISGRSARPAPQPSQAFAPTPFGFVHIDLKHLTRLQGEPAFVFVAIERTTRFVHIEIVNRRDAHTIAACLERFAASFGYPIHTILTDNGAEFTDRFAVDMKGKPDGRPSGRHPFDAVCRRLQIEHRLTRPFHPQTNGMVERFNRRIAQAIAGAPKSTKNTGKNTFSSQKDRTEYLTNFVNAYNRTRLRCLSYKAPSEILANQTEHNTKAGTQPATRAGRELASSFR